MPEAWRKCSQCKKDIPLGGIYQVCSVSTCRAKATNYVFCTVACWDAHVPVERHRPDAAAAIEKRAPMVPEAEPKRVVVGASADRSAPRESTLGEDEVLVVASKVRKYIADVSGLSTSAGVYDALTVRIRRLCDRAIEEARRQGRKTVMDRDLP